MKLYKAVLMFLTLAVNAQTQAESKIILSHDIKEITKQIQAEGDQESLILFDLHNVVLTQESQLLRPCGEAMLVRHLNAYQNEPRTFKVLEQSILKNRNQNPLTPDTVPLINQLIESFQVLFLTSYPVNDQDMDMEKYRYHELENIGLQVHDIEFSPYGCDSTIKQKDMSFYKNIIFCGNDKKGLALKTFLRAANNKPKKIYFVDDRLKNVQDVYEACEEMGIEYIGFYYTESQLLACELDIMKAKKQLHYLSKHRTWLDDDQL